MGFSPREGAFSKFLKAHSLFLGFNPPHYNILGPQKTPGGGLHGAVPIFHQRGVFVKTPGSLGCVLGQTPFHMLVGVFPGQPPWGVGGHIFFPRRNFFPREGNSLFVCPRVLRGGWALILGGAKSAGGPPRGGGSPPIPRFPKRNIIDEMVSHNTTVVFPKRNGV